MGTSPSLPRTEGCVSMVQSRIRASWNATNHLQNTRSLLFARRGGDREVRIGFGVPPGLCAGHVWARRQLQPLGFSVPSETAINTSWFLTQTVRSFILLYLNSTLKIQIPSITICFNMHVLLVKCRVKAQLSSQPQWY